MCQRSYARHKVITERCAGAWVHPPANRVLEPARQRPGRRPQRLPARHEGGESRPPAALLTAHVHCIVSGAVTLG